jgi:putative SOS response-associated peptidase YedK
LACAILATTSKGGNLQQRHSEQLLECAEISEANEDSDGHPIQAFPVITTDANEFVALIYNRMPVIFQREAEPSGLAADEPLNELLSYLRPYPAGRMRAYQVSTLVNSATIDQLELIKPER